MYVSGDFGGWGGGEAVTKKKKKATSYPLTEGEQSAKLETA